MQKKYLFASASAVAAAFLSITIYPEHHGMKAGGSWGLLLLGGAVLGLLVFIVYKATTTAAETPTENDTPTPEATSAPAPMDPERQKKMYYLWSAFTVVLSISLLRYPFAEYFVEQNPVGLRMIFSAACGVALIGVTAVHVWRTIRK